MLQKIRNSRITKGFSVFMILSFLFEILAPNRVLALTGGPSQPEFSSFTPVGTSDMVDLASGDMSYNIPLMDVGGYPLNLAYNSGVGMDDEASWVGLGWNLSVGQINRNVRGLPDDFNGDELIYENDIKKNVTVGVDFKFNPCIAGKCPDTLIPGQEVFSPFDFGLSATYNNSTGFLLKPSFGANFDIGNICSVGFNATSGPEGMNLSPTASIHGNKDNVDKRGKKLTGTVGASFNSRQGLQAMTLSASRKTQHAAMKNRKGKTIQGGGWAGPSIGSTIGFTDNLYTPTKRVGMISGSFTFNAALGIELFGVEGQGQITAYGTYQKIKDDEKVKYVKGYGYVNTEKAIKVNSKDNHSDVLDFNREKDGAFSINTTNLPITNYTYDIYSVQGQGVSGMYRPFRNQIGYVFDTYTEDDSYSGAFGAEFGSGNAFHMGVDLEYSKVTSYSGVWENDNLMINNLKPSQTNPFAYENVHYKNVGDLSVDQNFDQTENTSQYDRLFSITGKYQPTRIPFVGEKFFRFAQNVFLSKYGVSTESNLFGSKLVDLNEQNVINSKIKRNKRHNRNQAIYNLTVGQLKSGIGYGPCVYRENGASFTPEVNLPSGAKNHHTAEVQIIRNDGARYIYGLPVYNITKKEVSFSTTNASANLQTGIATYDLLGDKPKYNVNDEYFERITTPEYVHTHLLTSVLSADYQDRTNNGPSKDDLGSYTKFEYEKVNGETSGAPNYKWRVPFEGANFNEGLKTNDEDDQGNYTYGEKEMYYIKRIRTKTHIAVFEFADRKDAIGVTSEHTAGSGAKSKKLVSISLYALPEYEANGTSATPIKQVHFRYNYNLCKGVPNRIPGTDQYESSNNGGKLTLEKVFFTYRNSSMGKYTPYRFSYGSSSQENPNYNIKGYDTWGNYLPNNGNGSHTSVMTAPEFPYVEQDKSIQDIRSSVWSLKQITLPSGGKINIEYESDDYAYVQDKQVMRMFKIVGAGKYNQGNSDENEPTIHDLVYSDIRTTPLYSAGISNPPFRYLYAEIPTPESALTDEQVKNKYLTGLNKNLMQFRFLMNMTQAGGFDGIPLHNNMKFDYVSGYCQIDASRPASYFTTNNKHYISIPVSLVNKEGGLFGSEDVNPISKAAWHFARKYLSKYAYSNQVNGDTDDLEEIVTNLLTPDVLENLIEIFNGPNATLENKFVGRNFVTNKSFVRLMEPSGKKLGGGCRVKTIRMSDIWTSMNPGQGYQTMNYGQEYKYTSADGKKSSGVATYEPVGNKENPLVQPVFSTTEHLLAPDEQNYLETPFGESFFPNPQVTYSRVEVSNLVAGTKPYEGAQIKQLHRTGKVVTEFYTSKDYPTIVDQTQLQAEEDKIQSLSSILNLYARKYFTASQGYVIHLNDMNGKQKSQRVYAEGQEEFISGVDYLYDNYQGSSPIQSGTPAEKADRGKLNNKVTVIYPNGKVRQEFIGVESDVVNDFRENYTKTNVFGINANLATFFVGIIPGVIPVPLPDYSHSEDRFRSVTTTKVINTFGILKETIAYDAGASVSTRNLAWDAVTGEVLVTQTVDEYNDQYYTLNYPAHWNYKAMGNASQNLGIKGVLTVNGSSYGVQNISNVKSYFIEGDELAYIDTDGKAKKVWVTYLANTFFKLMNETGQLVNGLGGKSFEVVRSGHRNLQSAGIMNVTLMKNPLVDSQGELINTIDPNYLIASDWEQWKIINAGAVLYSDNWPVSCECFGFQNGTTSNPYVTNAKGVWRTLSSRTYLTGRRYEDVVTPRRDGFFTKFSPMYKINTYGNWSLNTANWTFVSEVSRFSPFGFELENVDALGRFSAAVYGYNNTFPMAVGANTRYTQIAFDGFEDYGFDGCEYNQHFSYKDALNTNISREKNVSHTGKYSLKVKPNTDAVLQKRLNCYPAKRTYIEILDEY